MNNRNYEERQLPANVDAERTILGSVLIDNSLMRDASVLAGDDFSLESHRRLWSVLQRMHGAGLSLSTITLLDELQKGNVVASVGGAAYVASLEEGIPRRPSIAPFVRILREKAALRQIIHTAHAIGARALEQCDTPAALASEFGMAMAAIETGSGERERTLFMPGMDFMAQAQLEIDWLVEGVIQRGANGFFAAQPKAGKSWAATDLALSLALGCRWLDFRIPRPAKVALISREDNPGLTQWRMKRLHATKYRLASLDLVNENLLVNTREQSAELMLDNPQQLAELLKSLHKHRPEFAIFDVFNCLHAADENSNEEMRRVLRHLSKIQTEIGCGIAVIHHYNKAEGGSLTQRLRGSGAIAGWCEWLIGISMADAESRTRKMEFELKAAAPPDAVHYRIESDDQQGWAKLETCDAPVIARPRKGLSPVELMQ